MRERLIKQTVIIDALTLNDVGRFEEVEQSRIILTIDAISIIVENTQLKRTTNQIATRYVPRHAVIEHFLTFCLTKLPTPFWVEDATIGTHTHLFQQHTLHIITPIELLHSQLQRIGSQPVVIIKHGNKLSTRSQNARITGQLSTTIHLLLNYLHT